MRRTTLADALRACALHGAKLVANAEQRRGRLAEALRALLAAYALDPAVARAAGAASWSRDRGELFEALLQAGQRALACGSGPELRLAALISDALLTERPRSRAGWRLRAQVLEELGDEDLAAEAHERYVALCDGDDLGILPRVAGLRQSAASLDPILALLEAELPAARSHAGRHDAELWSEGVASGDLARQVAALRAMVDQGRPAAEIATALGQFMDAYVADRQDRGAPLADARELLARYAEYRALRERGPLPDPLLGGTRVVTLGDFRNLVAGRTICLVANSQLVGSGRMGAEIDSYDLVVRFNSFRIDPRATGERTDIHATIHKHGFNWDRRVDIRLVFGGVDDTWRRSMRQRLVPGAQSYVNDASLRWPVRDVGRLDETVLSTIPTSGFNMLWLLDFLDVNPRIDLIGFDFYASGAYRLPAAMKLPIASVHGYQSEREWVMERAREITDTRIALR
ncbi:hypothetical protein E1265_27875 [Streptomyces sp. 8K308]|nr:hypothetical protein E1265_27875 [Streptomyces sp. 8K308]